MTFYSDVLQLRFLAILRSGKILRAVWFYPELLLKVCELRLDAILQHLERVGCRSVCTERLVHQVLCLDDVALEHAAAEIVIDGEGHRIVLV